MLAKLYTVGYHSLSHPTELKQLADERGAVVADIRLKPWSQRPDWTRDYLADTLGKSYKWVVDLGNLNYKNGGQFKLYSPRTGLTMVLDKLRAGTSVILLCGCYNHHECHRSFVADLLGQAISDPRFGGLAGRHLEVEHLYGSKLVTPVGGRPTTSRETGPANGGRIMMLSVWQPWAELIISCGKDIENRSWPTSYRGLVLLHAGKKFDDSCLLQATQIKGAPEAVNRQMFPGCDIPLFVNRYHRGGIVGAVEIVDCIPSEERTSPWHIAGQYGFKLVNPRRLDFVPLRGYQRFFHVSDEVLEELGLA